MVSAQTVNDEHFRKLNEFIKANEPEDSKFLQRLYEHFYSSVSCLKCSESERSRLAIEGSMNYLLKRRKISEDLLRMAQAGKLNREKLDSTRNALSKKYAIPKLDFVNDYNDKKIKEILKIMTPAVKEN